MECSHFLKYHSLVFTLLISAILFAGCPTSTSTSISGRSSSSGSSGSTASATPTPTPSALSNCSTQVADYGEKGVALARGLYSDVRMIPGTSNPATAYVDQNSLSLKFSYFSSGRWRHEVVSGDGAGTFVRLGFLSSGLPIILWAQGGNLKAAVRSLSVTSTSTAQPTWTAAIVDTGTAPRAIEMAINPLDEVAVSFMTDTATAGRAKFLYCPAGCASPLSFQVMTPNAYIENSNITAATTSTGVSWCRSSSTVYYPVISYSLSASTRYAVCQNTLSNCLSSTNWSLQTVVASSTIGSKVYLDPTVTGDVPKVIAKTAAGIVTYRMGATACTSAPAAFTAGTTLGGANTGTLWMQLLKDTVLGFFHVVANETTTNVRYYNNSSTDINASWNAVGTVETSTFAAAYGGGADISTSSSAIFASYATNVAPFVFRMSRVNNYTVASSAATFTNFDPNLTGAIHLTASQRGNVSAASTSAGRPAIAYVDYSVGAVAAAKLKYSYRRGSSATDQWDNAIVPETGSPQHPSLRFDHNDKPWISYFDASYNLFFLVTNSATDGSGTWTSYRFPATVAGAPVALPAANETALAMSTVAGVSSPVMFIIDTNAGSRGVKAAKLDYSTRGWSTVATIDALAVAGASNLSADGNSTGEVVVVYRDIGSNRAEYSYSANSTTWTTPFVISGANQGFGLRIKINSATGSPGVVFQDQVTNTFYYAPCSGTLSGCATAGWSAGSLATGVGISGLANTSYQLISSSLNYISGAAYIAYPAGQGGAGSLLGLNNSSGSFSSSTLSSGANAALSGTPAINFGVAGWGVASTTSGTGLVHAYIGPGNWLYVTSCGE